MADQLSIKIKQLTGEVFSLKVLPEVKLFSNLIVDIDFNSRPKKQN